MKYEVRSKVKILNSTYGTTPYPGLESVGKLGVVEDCDISDSAYYVAPIDGPGDWFNESDLAPVGTTWDSLVAGETVLVDGFAEHLVLVTSPDGNVFLPSTADGFDRASSYWYTVAEARKLGWTIKQPESDEPVIDTNPDHIIIGDRVLKLDEVLEATRGLEEAS